MPGRVPRLTSAAIGRAFRRLPDLKNDIAKYNSLDDSTREAWELACRDVLLSQPAGTVCNAQINRDPVSSDATEWWPRVVKGE